MSGSAESLISHAQVALGLGKVVVDPDGYPSTGDEYYENKINECIFHSQENIDEPICVICRIKDTHEKCVDLWMGLDEFEHGLLLNTQIPGVTVTANANGNFPNEVMIFDGDTLGGFGEGTTPDPDLRADADCPDCAGLHIAVIPEFITGSAGDGIVDVPDDSAWGGTQTWVFDQPWFLRP